MWQMYNAQERVSKTITWVRIWKLEGSYISDWRRKVEVRGGIIPAKNRILFDLDSQLLVGLKKRDAAP